MRIGAKYESQKLDSPNITGFFFRILEKKNQGGGSQTDNGYFFKNIINRFIINIALIF